MWLQAPTLDGSQLGGTWALHHIYTQIDIKISIEKRKMPPSLWLTLRQAQSLVAVRWALVSPDLDSSEKPDARFVWDQRKVTLIPRTCPSPLPGIVQREKQRQIYAQTGASKSTHQGCRSKLKDTVLT